MLNAMNSQDVLELNSKQFLKETFNFDHYKESQHVFFDLGPRSKQSANDSMSTDYGSVESPVKPRLNKPHTNNKKGLSIILVREFNQAYHPIRIIKESFMMMFQMKYRERLNTMGAFTI